MLRPSTAALPSPPSQLGGHTSGSAAAAFAHADSTSAGYSVFASPIAHLLSFAAFVLLLLLLGQAASHESESGADPTARVTLELYLALVQIIFFLWIFGAALIILHANSINYRLLFPHPVFEPLHADAQGRPSALAHESLLPANVLATASALTLAVGLLYLQQAGGLLGRHALDVDGRFFPSLSLCLALVYLLLPADPSERPLRQSFASLFGQVLASSVWPFFGFRFSHLLLSDILTSACLMLYQVSLLGCTFASLSLSPSSSLHPSNCSSQGHFAVWARPLLCALPCWIRVVQCIYCWAERQWDVSSWESLQHPVNAVKYLSGLLVVLLASLASFFSDPSLHSTSQVWWYLVFFAQVLKTVLSLSWDVWMDWDLGWPSSPPFASSISSIITSSSAISSPPPPLSPPPSFSFSSTTTTTSTASSIIPTIPTAIPSSSSSFPFFLRKKRLFRWTICYYVAMIANGMARMSWLLLLADRPSSWVFTLALVEVARRGLWIVFRIEAQLAKIFLHEEDQDRKKTPPMDIHGE